jgi:four helix bundle protein
MIRFRFENLEIWQRSVELGRQLFRFANSLEEKRLYRFADQVRGAGLSIPNNIAEGAGSTSKREFVQFLNIARRSTFEIASMVIIFFREGLISGPEKEQILKELDELCRMITAFSRTLGAKEEQRAKSKE